MLHRPLRKQPWLPALSNRIENPDINATGTAPLLESMGAISFLRASRCFNTTPRNRPIDTHFLVGQRRVRADTYSATKVMSQHWLSLKKPGEFNREGKFVFSRYQLRFRVPADCYLLRLLGHA